MKEREDFIKNMAELNSSDLIFIDESGTNLGFTRLYGRTKVGDRVHDSKPKNEGKNLTLIGAISLTGVLASMTVEGGVKKEVFYAYIEQVLLPELEFGKIVLMDNLSSHKSILIEELIKSKGAKLIYLPRYSPDLNPIELCWSKVKAYLRLKKARTKELLETSIAQALELVTGENCQGWFGHCGYNAN